jgi:PAS domain S-box-containing protein
MKTNLLLIDDEEGIRKVLGLTLKDAGYEVSIAIDGEHGLELFKQENPAIVLTDIKMPGLDGIEVLRRIKSISPDTEVIVITGHGEIELAIKSLQLEASDFITKPIHEEALFIALKRAEEKLAWKRLVKRYNEDLKTRIQEATSELKKSYAFQDKLLQSSMDGIIGTDHAGKIILFNPSAQNLTGYPLEEIQDPTLFLKQVVPEWSAFVARALQGLCPAETPCLVTQGQLFSKSGETIPIQLSGTLLFEKDRLVGTVCCLQDLRELERLQKELLRAERLAATGQTVAGLAHAIKNILGGLKGGRFMVNKGFELNEMKYLKDGWDMVERNIEKISGLTKDLLEFCRDREPEREMIDPNRLVQEVYELFQVRAQQLGVTLSVDLDEKIGATSLDPRGIHEVLSNLVGNALDACTLGEAARPNPEVTIRSSLLPEARILLEVRDNGLGMDKEIRKKLFTIFFSTKGSRGTGLGLLLSQKIVQEHGGEIKVHSEPLKGSTFQVVLPVRTGSQAKGDSVQ